MSCCRDVSASRPLLLNKLCCLVNWLSICRKFSRLWESCLSIVFIYVGLETVPCINSAREFIRVNELCCLVNWLSICRRFSRLRELVIHSCRPPTISTLGTVPCINSAREFRRVRDAETSWQQDTKTTTGTQARQEQGRVEKKKSQPLPFFPA